MLFLTRFFGILTHAAVPDPVTAQLFPLGKNSSIFFLLSLGEKEFEVKFELTFKNSSVKGKS